MIPSVSIRKVDMGTGVVRPGDVGVAAIIAPSESGGTTAEKFLSVEAALATVGGGALVHAAAYVMPVSGNPVLLVKGGGSTPAAYGAVVPGDENDGATVASAGDTDPLDDFGILVTCLVSGTVGTPGIVYTYSCDGGLVTSAPQALGTETSIVIPDTGVTLDLTVASMVAGDTFAVTTTGPKNTNGDLADGLEALRLTRSPFETVLFDGPADGTTVETLDQWISAMELTGRFKTAICTARQRLATGETEAQYKDFLDGLFSSKHSLATVVCADVGDVVSPIPNRGTTSCLQARPVGWAVTARAMGIPMGQDPAFGGPVAGFSIQDDRGNTKHHDEFMSPGLDELRLTTLCSRPGENGSFITNANILSPAGSDFVYLQHARVINRASEIAFQILAQSLSIGVRKNPKVGPDGARYIAEGAALQIESVANAAINAELGVNVDEIRFTVSRTDDISSNSGADVHGSIECVSLAYIKKFTVTAGFVKSLSKQ